MVHVANDFVLHPFFIHVQSSVNNADEVEPLISQSDSTAVQISGAASSGSGDLVQKDRAISFLRALMIPVSGSDLV